MKDHLSIGEFYHRFPDEDTCQQYIATQRWGDTPACPRCKSTKVWKIKGGMPYKCGDCPKKQARFSVRTGTIMENSKVPLQKWLLAMYLMQTARKGISSIQLAKELGVTQQTAWFISHRIREAWSGNKPTLDGEVEVDEACFGGKQKNRHASKRRGTGRGPVGKAAVVGMKERGGAIVAQHVAKAEKAMLQPIVKSTVKEGSSVYTDDSRIYSGLERAFDHDTVKHSAGEYVKGKASTNGIESFWAVMKRGYYGTHHWWSIKHLHRYVAEYVYRANTRALRGMDLLSAAIQSTEGKHLSYQTLTQP